MTNDEKAKDCAKNAEIYAFSSPEQANVWALLALFYQKQPKNSEA